MFTHRTNAQSMHGMFAASAVCAVSAPGTASAYGWHRVRPIAVIEVFADTTKLPAPRRLSEAPL